MLVDNVILWDLDDNTDRKTFSSLCFMLLYGVASLQRCTGLPMPCSFMRFLNYNSEKVVKMTTFWEKNCIMRCVSFSCEMEKCIVSFFLFHKIHYAFRRKFRIWSISFLQLCRSLGFALGLMKMLDVSTFFKFLSLRFVTAGHKETFSCFLVNRSKLTRTNWLKECSWESIALALLISWLCWQHCKRFSQASAIDSQPPFDLLAVHFSLSSGFLG